MRTAESMYNNCLENGTGSGFSKRSGLRHFTIIEEVLDNNEEVYMTFIGLKDYLSVSDHKNNYAYAITNKRIIIGQSKLMGLGKDIQTISMDRISDISLSKGMVMGVVTIDTLGEVFNVGLDKHSAESIFNEAHRIIFEYIKNDSPNIKNQNDDPIEKIRQFKSLMDEGIISEAEFESKKKELLDI